MSLPGPSSLHRVAACPTSEALPHSRSSSEASHRGDVVHAYLAACALGGQEAALGLVPEEYRETIDAIPHDRLPPLDKTSSAPEVSFALTVATGECRELGRNLGREEARARARSTEMVGTADLVGLTADTAVVYDWKTGRGNHVERAEVNYQIRAYMLMAARTYGRDNAKGSLVRVLDDGTVWYDTVEMDSLDLDAFEGELRALMAQREEVLAGDPESRPPLHEGAHCKYCPALPFCPAKMLLLRETFSGELEKGHPLELTPERAASAWAKIEAAGKLLERLKEVVKEYARQSPFPTADGKWVGEVTKHRETIVAERAREALAEHFGPQLGGAVYGSVAETKVSVAKTKLKAALNRLVLPTIPGAKITHLEKETLEVLRKRGAISVTAFQQVEEHRPKDGEPPPKGRAPAPPPALEEHAPTVEAPAPPAPEWNQLSPEAKIEYGRGRGSVAELAAADERLRKDRDARIQACVDSGTHTWSRMGDCGKCGIRRPPEDAAVERTSGHPIRYDVKLCSCKPGEKPCVDGARGAA